MRTTGSVLGVLLLAIAAGCVACAGAQEPGVQEPPAGSGAPEGEAAAGGAEALGALQVTSVSAEPTDYFDVLQNGERAFEGNPKLLGGTLELPPGSYVVDVNRTRQEVTIEAGRTTVLQAGELIVEGEPATAYWYPMQGGERRLSSNPPLLNAPRALFPGSYEVFVHTSVTVPDRDLGAAEVTAGQRTVLRH